MNAAAAGLALTLVGVGGLTVGLGVMLRPPQPAAPGIRVGIEQGGPGLRTVAPAHADSAAALVVHNAPFRVTRAAPVLAYDPTQVGVSAEPQPAVPSKPTPTLVGIVWGAEPSAVLDGVPGSGRSRVMGRGDTAGGLRMRRVERTRVMVTGYDTAWTLQMKELP